MRMRNISNAFEERIKTHILCSITFLFLENCAVYEIKILYSRAGYRWQ
jgi:hypothetical protein